MRVAIFVAVVAAHLALLWLVTSLHRWVLLPAEDEAAITPIFLPPLPPEIAVEPIWETPEWDFQVQARVPEPTQHPVRGKPAGANTRSPANVRHPRTVRHPGSVRARAIGRTPGSTALQEDSSAAGEPQTPGKRGA